MCQPELTVELVAERMEHARRVLCVGHPEREALLVERRILMLTHVALRRIAKLTGQTKEEVATAIGLTSDKYAKIRASLKDPTFLSPKELEWYNNLLMTGKSIMPIRDPDGVKPE
ncbi:MAG TPA: hypothetical protein VLB83_03020 [Candidatus Paceibacterota bacterium]|nr:hypothetical protein [Candidatus Paceibacterota bacterium]